MDTHTPVLMCNRITTVFSVADNSIRVGMVDVLAQWLILRFGMWLVKRGGILRVGIREAPLSLLHSTYGTCSSQLSTCMLAGFTIVQCLDTYLNLKNTWRCGHSIQTCSSKRKHFSQHHTLFSPLLPKQPSQNRSNPTHTPPPPFSRSDAASELVKAT